VDLARRAALCDAKSVPTLTRADASEERLDAMRQNRPLPQVRYLHLATHGPGNDTVVFASALILTPRSRPPPLWQGAPYLDGRLTAAEGLAFWQLDAALVTLSACESGLGQRGGGEGLVGFAQAFRKVGSRSVCLPWWPVDDPATALRRWSVWAR
jgi:CHAT domain-containing protein